MELPVVLFIDEVCNKPYDPQVLATEALGGTEATVVRIAEGLALTFCFRVFVLQHNRTKVCNTSHALYCPLEESEVRPDYVISLRSPATLVKAKARFPDAKHYLWNHDLMTPEVARSMATLSGFVALAVSQFHKTQIVETLKPQGYQGTFPVSVIYNPIDDALVPDDTKVDPYKLVFFSSPHKGLEHALKLFTYLKRIDPLFRLEVANPGYFISDSDLPAGVKSLGCLAHSDIINSVRSSLCVFYPNFVFPETFGLVMAEANAVGTPVITHAIGAAPEVLYHPAELADCRSPKAVIDRVLAWQSGERPRVKANPKFRLSSVIKSWTRLLNGH